MFCKNCGTRLKADAKFCENCGAKVEDVESVAAVTTPVQEENGFAAFVHKTVNYVKSGKLIEGIKKWWRKPINLRRWLIWAGLIFIVQLIFIFVPIAEYEITTPIASKNQSGSIFLGDAMQNEFWLFLTLVFSIVGMIRCFITKKNAPYKKGKKVFLILAACINLFFVLGGMITSSGIVTQAVRNAEDKMGAGFIDYQFHYTFWCYFAIFIAVFQLIYLIIIGIKSRTHNRTIENSVESKLLKYKKLYDDGVLTKEEFDSKTKELLNIQEQKVE